MIKHFKVIQNKDCINVQQVSKIAFHHICLYLDGQLVAVYYRGDNFYVTLEKKHKHLMVVGFSLNNQMNVPIGEQYVLGTSGTRGRDFKAGDVLVASDNVFQALTGYMGHSAIVVDEHNVIESPGGHPAIRKDTIQQFLDKHPEHAQFRPVSSELGESAASYAKEYLAAYQQKLEKGEKKPVFSFKLTQSLEDPWEYIYCSKLIWLSYSLGADYKLDNDYLWYSPEDLYTNLKENDDFKTIYQHEFVKFHIDT
ncbi:C40 family peptidase [Aquibacillus rhizosphaerae]|uniref:Permuted papain-like amidase YaeF/Yiix C92 family enzyme n=1 Tax=Aquibacillus rhizosphaerae TaxID=3051431 RepID=A0ABT7L0Y5_9BACI|nr:hypothetical protein [Aquibacillus sp. LR5S19]MDL4839014.1 hypothetical protein [Aquibacillus sp. LR5S19]